VASDTDNRIRVSTRDFRSKLRDFFDTARISGKAIIVQSNEKDIVAIVSIDRLDELERKEKELESKNKVIKPHKRSVPTSLEPLVSYDTVDCKQ
jgi:hypothetical protein